MRPQDFKEEISKLEAGELTDQQIDQLRQLAGRDEQAAEYLEKVEQSLKTTQEAYDTTPDPGSDFTDKVMTAIQYDNQTNPFKMQDSPDSLRMKFQGKIIYALIAITILSGCILLFVSIFKWVDNNQEIEFPEENFIGTVIPWKPGAEIESLAEGIPSAPVDLTGVTQLKINDAVFTHNGQVEFKTAGSISITLDINTEVVFTKKASLRFEKGKLVVFRSQRPGTDDVFTIITPLGVVTVPSGATVVLSLDMDPLENEILEIVVINGRIFLETPDGKTLPVDTETSIRITVDGIHNMENLDIPEYIKWYNRLQQLKQERQIDK